MQNQTSKTREIKAKGNQGRNKVSKESKPHIFNEMILWLACEYNNVIL